MGCWLLSAVSCDQGQALNNRGDRID